MNQLIKSDWTVWNSSHLKSAQIYMLFNQNSPHFWIWLTVTQTHLFKLVTDFKRKNTTTNILSPTSCGKRYIITEFQLQVHLRAQEPVRDTGNAALILISDVTESMEPYKPQVKSGNESRPRESYVLLGGRHAGHLTLSLFLPIVKMFPWQLGNCEGCDDSIPIGIHHSDPFTKAEHLAQPKGNDFRLRRSQAK